jgi:hypothetical protein
MVHPALDVSDADLVVGAEVALDLEGVPAGGPVAIGAGSSGRRVPERQWSVQWQPQLSTLPGYTGSSA